MPIFSPMTTCSWKHVLSAFKQDQVFMSFLNQMEILLGLQDRPSVLHMPIKICLHCQCLQRPNAKVLHGSCKPALASRLPKSTHHLRMKQKEVPWPYLWLSTQATQLPTLVCASHPTGWCGFFYHLITFSFSVFSLQLSFI